MEKCKLAASGSDCYVAHDTKQAPAEPGGSEPSDKNTNTWQQKQEGILGENNLGFHRLAKHAGAENKLDFFLPHVQLNAAGRFDKTKKKKTETHAADH